ncbi:hypothetical protein AMATHDRAFT_143024 [Amanita thiersii Skay4041]|uniref:Cytochrome c oxidase assembly protein COX20, mitochondrial n=1 Tax=Amanita thiersii Skay4041 TaxID=703135 RepID=A0A2A9NUA4_9AGAR|nr:hypothetical protein AMATHDRAFT_143024 [Amanita thiersii Skay4041]
MSDPNNNSDPNTTVLPSRVPPPTGNLTHDALESAKHITDIPCARGALLSGIASGAGIGVIRGLSAGPMVAGHWAMATFALISIGSWHLCQKQFADERKRVAKIMESTPRKLAKQQDQIEPESSA